jgi:hypothetical protein
MYLPLRRKKSKELEKLSLVAQRQLEHKRFF